MKVSPVLFNFALLPHPPGGCVKSKSSPTYTCAGVLCVYGNVRDHHISSSLLDLVHKTQHATTSDGWTQQSSYGRCAGRWGSRQHAFLSASLDSPPPPPPPSPPPPPPPPPSSPHFYYFIKGIVDLWQQQQQQQQSLFLKK